jgi:hypothetical protein
VARLPFSATPGGRDSGSELTSVRRIVGQSLVSTWAMRIVAAAAAEEKPAKPTTNAHAIRGGHDRVLERMWRLDRHDRQIA